AIWLMDFMPSTSTLFGPNRQKLDHPHGFAAPHRDPYHPKPTLLGRTSTAMLGEPFLFRQRERLPLGEPHRAEDLLGVVPSSILLGHRVLHIGSPAPRQLVTAFVRQRDEF